MYVRVPIGSCSSLQNPLHRYLIREPRLKLFQFNPLALIAILLRRVA